VKIVLITTGQPACNPRIVKEADAFFNAGYDVTLLYCFFIDWAQESDERLLTTVKWKYKLVGGSKSSNSMLFHYTRVRFKLSRILNKYIGNRFGIAETAQARAYTELLYEAKKIKADWYIGHNLGALSIAANAAKYHNAKSGFDFEDYHKGETNNQVLLKRYEYLEHKYLKHLSYYSTASDLITEITRKNHSYFKGRIVTILNCFLIKNQPLFISKKKEDNALNLFWFSQTIGANRGIEILIESLILLNNPLVTVTLAGRCDDAFKKYIDGKIANSNCKIHFAGIIHPNDLPDFATQFDIGLALETGFSKNNDIALSNKIFTYLLSGLAIISSETTMQKQFAYSHAIGETFPIGDSVKLAEVISSYFSEAKLNRQKLYNYNLAKNQLNWENESQKLLEIVT
jgi:hypothetical protein